ncbi:hypothetical protein V500_04720 [Pseudogymnoascus sp. VKM F-4518 (FW-2643)]|nr:hypothetical protein V500_04720 [Pseudogymnoascus sp. VKM F-4518 (FW-2643)]
MSPIFLALDGLVPEGGDGNAHDDRANDGPQAVDNEDAKHDVAEAVDHGGGEDALVLEDNGEFRQDEGRIVAWDCSPEALHEGRDILLRNRGKGRSEAIFNFYHTHQLNSFSNNTLSGGALTLKDNDTEQNRSTLQPVSISPFNRNSLPEEGQTRTHHRPEREVIVNPKNPKARSGDNPRQDEDASDNGKKQSRDNEWNDSLNVCHLGDWSSLFCARRGKSEMKPQEEEKGNGRGGHGVEIDNSTRRRRGGWRWKCINLQRRCTHSRLRGTKVPMSQSRVRWAKLLPITVGPKPAIHVSLAEHCSSPPLAPFP